MAQIFGMFSLLWVSMFSPYQGYTIQNGDTIPSVSAEKVYSAIVDIIKQNLLAFNLDDGIQDLRIVKNRQIESILFEVPIVAEFNKKEEFNRQCSLDLTNQYPDSKIIIEYKSQMSIR